MACLIPTSLYGVIGWPLAQSLSPLIHNTALEKLRIPAAYLAWPVAPEMLKAFVASLRIFRVMGVSVTIPHKVEVMPLLDNFSEAAALAGAVNTLFWRGEELCGDNTDVSGFLSPLNGLLAESMSILLLGAGGAARAVASGLRMRGCYQVRVASPGNRRQFELAERFSFTPILWEQRYEHEASLIVNATPLGMHGELVHDTPYNFDLAPARGQLAYDLVYNPVLTRFLKEARQAGWEIITGVEMFLAQAEAQFKLWTGQAFPPVCREVLERALRA